jgi:hypothetical protein
MHISNKEDTKHKANKTMSEISSVRHTEKKSNPFIYQLLYRETLGRQPSL